MANDSPPKLPSTKKPGPEGDTLVVKLPWKDAIKNALAKKRPANGWPERPVKKRKRRKNK